VAVIDLAAYAIFALIVRFVDEGILLPAEPETHWGPAEMLVLSRRLHVRM
jgi:hypothetical protein